MNKVRDFVVGTLELIAGLVGMVLVGAFWIFAAAVGVLLSALPLVVAFWVIVFMARACG